MKNTKPSTLLTLLDKKPIPPYSPLEIIRGALLKQVQVPFNGVPVMCTLKCLNQAEIMSIGSFGIFSHLEKKDKPEVLTFEDKVKTLELQRKIAELCMVIPTYTEFEDVLLGGSGFYEQKKNDLAKERENLNSKTGIHASEKVKIMKRINNIELQLEFMLPTDTGVFLMRWGLGLDETPYELLTEETLLRAAVLAKKGNKSPHDFISGPFADYQKNLIDEKAYQLIQRHIDKEELVRKAHRRNK